MTAERWLPVVGWEAFYEVSDWGRVRSIDRPVRGKGGLPRNIRGRILRPAGQYPSVILHDGKRRKCAKIHQLVLDAFVGPRPPGADSCHNNGNRYDNRLENLRYDSRSENALDRVRHGTHPMASKTHCKRGHEFTPENTIKASANGGRRCRTCTVQYHQNYDAARLRKRS